VDIEIEKRERFEHLRVVQVPVQEAIKNPISVFKKIQG